MFDFDTARMIRAGLALQTAAIEWDGDKTPMQAEARQALMAMREALNLSNSAFVSMTRISEKRRNSK